MRQYKMVLDPLGEFQNELDCIKGKVENQIACSAILQLPSYFWVVPASSSGKYHPTTSLGLGGLLRHTKSVFAISEELLTHPLYAPFTPETKDRIRVAILLHDGLKQGVTHTGHTVAEHPRLIRHNIDPLLGLESDFDVPHKDILDVWHIICDMIETHMGVWNKDREGNKILESPSSEAQLFVHLCDFLASRRVITVDIFPRDNVVDNKDWKNEPATLVQVKGKKPTGQIPYIMHLYKMCGEKGITDLPAIQYTDKDGNIILTKGEASDIIEGLKGRLGL